MDVDSVARSAMEFMARELSQASADKYISMKVESEYTGSWESQKSDSLYFVSMNSLAEYYRPPIGSGIPYRDVQQIRYGVITNSTGRYSLVRWAIEKEELFTAYSGTGSDWWLYMKSFDPAAPNSSMASIADNLVAFRVNIYTVTTNGVSQYRESYDSLTDGPPVFADLYISLVDDRDATRAEGMSGSDRTDYVNSKARRYSTRVYFQNRLGENP